MLPLPAILLDLATFSAIIAAMLVLGLAIMIVYKPPTRVCMQCGADVSITRRRCRGCGYEFE